MSEVNLGDYNRGGYIAFMFSMAVTTIFFIYIAFIHPGVDLKEMEVPAAQKEAAGTAATEAPVAAEQPKDAAASEQGVDAKDAATTADPNAQQKEATGDPAKAAAPQPQKAK